MLIILFGCLSVLAILSAIGVILSPNPIYSVLSLIVCFFAIAGHYLLLQAQFLAVVHIIVYAGAIMVLFLFVIMLMNLNKDTEPKKNPRFKALAVVASGTLLLVLVGLLKNFKSAPAQATIEGSAKALGQVLFKDYLVPFELSSILFVAAVIGVVLIGKLRDDA